MAKTVFSQMIENTAVVGCCKYKILFINTMMHHLKQQSIQHREKIISLYIERYLSRMTTKNVEMDKSIKKKEKIPSSSSSYKSVENQSHFLSKYIIQMDDDDHHHV
ncbi:hypothetical protein DERF_010896 [Dermatophagoides farinae]|uniref:Uncharacterized protein n=1 Tax=Dermatophagoides farinae TaxID=6954 RepID=A0A922KZP0_DERFA|nr:hypothetical protein DERF_010896 [Dermatophagoides farinae]